MKIIINWFSKERYFVFIGILSSIFINAQGYSQEYNCIYTINSQDKRDIIILPYNTEVNGFIKVCSAIQVGKSSIKFSSYEIKKTSNKHNGVEVYQIATENGFFLILFPQTNVIGNEKENVTFSKKGANSIDYGNRLNFYKKKFNEKIKKTKEKVFRVNIFLREKPSKKLLPTPYSTTITDNIKIQILSSNRKLTYSEFDSLRLKAGYPINYIEEKNIPYKHKYFLDVEISNVVQAQDIIERLESRELKGAFVKY